MGYRDKPHKRIINQMKEKYFHARSEARHKNFSKQQQVDLCYLQHEIETRWFRFFADHYIQDTVDTYCSIVHNAPDIRTN